MVRKMTFSRSAFLKMTILAIIIMALGRMTPRKLTAFLKMTIIIIRMTISITAFLRIDII